MHKTSHKKQPRKAKASKKENIETLGKSGNRAKEDINIIHFPKQNIGIMDKEDQYFISWSETLSATPVEFRYSEKI